MHRAVYSFVPHDCGFGAKAVIQPSYMLNVPHIVSEGVFEAKALVNTDKSNIIVESIKPCEDEDRAFIIRLYEAEGTRTNSTVKFSEDVKKLAFINMLEEETEAPLKVIFLPHSLDPLKSRASRHITNRMIFYLYAMFENLHCTA